jgi:hypothetical protein
MKREFLERVGLVILENIPLGEALSQEERSAIDTSLLPEKVLSGMLKDREVQVWGAA